MPETRRTNLTRTLILCLALLALPLHASAETVLRILTHYTDAQRAPLTDCLRAYVLEHPDIRIVQQQAEIDDYLQTILTGRLSGTSPDIYNIYSVWSAQLVRDGLFAPPPPTIGDLIARSYEPATVRTIQVGGKVWGIPTEVSAFLLIWNKALFRQAGLTAPPADWDQFAQDAARLTRRNAQGRITTAGIAYGPSIAATDYPFLAQLLSRGIPLFTPDHRGTNLASPIALDVLRRQVKLFHDGITDATIGVRDFPSGAVGMMIFANWYKQTLRQAFGAAFDDTVGVAPIPAGPDWRTLQYAFFWAVDAHSRHAAAAWRLLAWLNTPRTAGQPSCTGAMLGRIGALTGNRADLAADPADFGDAFDKPFADAIASGRAEGLANVPFENEVLDDLRLAIEQAWTGARLPEQALGTAGTRANAVLNDPD